MIIWLLQNETGGMFAVGVSVNILLNKLFVINLCFELPDSQLKLRSARNIGNTAGSFEKSLAGKVFYGGAMLSF